MITRPFSTAGPYGHVPGAAPPLHSAQVDPGDQSRPGMSRVSGNDVDPLDNAPGPVGLRSWDGGNLGYAGRDVTDQQTWGNRPYNEEPGMLARLHQEAAQ
jgi:hypothetical protein